MPGPRTFWAIYMVGAHLEGGPRPAGGGTLDLGTGDLGQLAAAAGGAAGVELLIGLGGARKESWRGLRTFGAGCLVADLADGVAGNDPCVAVVDAAADMAATETLAGFLRTVKARSAGYERVLVTFWSDGRAYEGLGPDAWSRRSLRPDQIGQAFEAAALKPDLIGFDACLMGNLEVARLLAPHARYMVGSANDEPAHGWQYSEVASWLAEHPAASAADVGRALCDSFVDSPTHRGNPESHGRTQALYALERVPAVIAALETLGAGTTAAAPALRQALAGVRTYGKDGTTMDLIDFAERLGAGDPALAGACQALAEAAREAVVHARDDGSLPRTYGMSVFNLGYDAGRYGPSRYDDAVAAGPAWRALAAPMVRPF